MKNIAIIPARSGSKGLKDKNIKLLNGKPLMAYTIEAALESNMFDTVMVSTDSQEYARIAKEYGADVPFLRSKEMSSDEAGSWDVVKEVVDKYRNLGITFDTVCLLQPTSPLRNSNDIIEAYKLFYHNNCDSLSSVCEIEHPLEYCRTINMDLSMSQIIQVEEKFRRQESKKIYRLNGAVYIRKIFNFDNYCEINNNFNIAYVMKLENSIDIDTETDFEFSEFIIKKKLFKRGGEVRIKDTKSSRIL